MCVIGAAAGDVGFVMTSGDDVGLSEGRVDVEVVSVTSVSEGGVSFFCPLGGFILIIRYFADMTSGVMVTKTRPLDDCCSPQ